GAEFVEVKSHKEMMEDIFERLYEENICYVGKWYIKSLDEQVHHAEIAPEQYELNHLIALAEDKRVPRALVDYKLCSEQLSTQDGYGITMNDWVLALQGAEVGRGEGRSVYGRSKRYKRASGIREVLTNLVANGAERSKLIDIIHYHREEREDFVINLMTAWAHTLSQSKLSDLYFRLMRLRHRHWYSTLSRVANMVSQSSVIMGHYIPDEDRRILYDLARLANVSKTQLTVDMINNYNLYITPKPPDEVRNSVTEVLTSIIPYQGKGSIANLQPNIAEVMGTIGHLSDAVADLMPLQKKISRLSGSIYLYDLVVGKTVRQQIAVSWLLLSCAFLEKNAPSKELNLIAQTYRMIWETDNRHYRDGALWSSFMIDIIDGGEREGHDFALNVAVMLYNRNIKLNDIQRRTVEATCCLASIGSSTISYKKRFSKRVAVQLTASMPQLRSSRAVITELCTGDLGIPPQMLIWLGSRWYTRMGLLTKWIRVASGPIAETVTLCGLDWLLCHDNGSEQRLAAIAQLRRKENLPDNMVKNYYEAWSGYDASNALMSGICNYVYGTTSCAGLATLTPDFTQVVFSGKVETIMCKEGLLSDENVVEEHFNIGGARHSPVPPPDILERLKLIEETDPIKPAHTSYLEGMLNHITKDEIGRSNQWDAEFAIPQGIIGFIPTYLVPLIDWYGRYITRQGL
ncbi:hypothetical protein MMARV_C055P1, partial [viral metagenome]